ncbi:hypothetical protein G3I76_07950, partial [Streptomyces sp. SID11233]|nr:hypothetical protein [Streptomyces sp. SID11233]
RETEFHDLDRITTVASGLRASQAESLTSLRAIGLVIETHEDLDTSPQHAPVASRTQAAVARSAPSTGTKSGTPVPTPAASSQRP